MGDRGTRFLGARARRGRDPCRCGAPSPDPARCSCARCVSGVSRGTEALVFEGRVPQSQHDAMRAPFQEGDFPGPVKYGYLSVGVVEEGPADLRGSHGVLPAPAPDPLRRPRDGGARRCPTACPPRRAVLAGTVETAVNALWDARPLVGDRVSVVGAGMVGCCVARLLARIPGVAGDARRRRPLAGRGRRGSRGRLRAPRRGAGRTGPRGAHQRHVGRAAALARPAGAGGRRWSTSAGTATPRCSSRSGGRFHSDRLSIRSSQVGTVATARRGRRTTAERMGLALELLRDPAFDVLLTGTSRFEELPDVMPQLAVGQARRRCATDHLRREELTCSA